MSAKTKLRMKYGKQISIFILILIIIYNIFGIQKDMKNVLIAKTELFRTMCILFLLINHIKPPKSITFNIQSSRSLQISNVRLLADIMNYAQFKRTALLCGRN